MASATAHSNLEQCHITYCENFLDSYLTGKISRDTFLHHYYHTIVPLTRNYEFQIPETMIRTVTALEYPHQYMQLQ